LSIADAIKICLDEHRDLKSAKNTIRKYRYMLSALARFSEQSGLRYLAEWKPVHVREFRASWGNGLSTIRVKMRNLKSFFEIFVEDQRLEYNPARLRLPKNRAARESTPSSQKNPYTNAELERMFAACTHLGQSALRRQPKRIDGRRVVSITPYRQYHRRWTGADLADFMEISVYTGLRICDVATFHISRLTPAGEVNVRCTKNGNWVGVWVPPFLRAIIRERAARYGPEIFGRHRTADVDVITSGWRRRLEKVWELAGPWESKPSHHRFRHTFVRILLERHTPIPLIAELIGDSEAAIRRHYAAWNKERQEQTSRLLEQAFSHMPRFRQA
jgi:site-specific recombinase XerD